jgi:hypothetical protein
MIERQILTAEEAERERRINVRLGQAVQSERWVHRGDVAWAVAAERERCAKIAEAYYCSDSDRMSGDAVAIDARERIAARIRSRT